jgi:hypothetical protein
MRIRARHAAALFTAALCAGALAACATAPPGPARALDLVRADAADFARDLHRGPTDTIDDYARWADEDSATGNVELIGFEAFDGATHGEPFGALRLRATLDRGEYAEPFAACFESEFDFWGVVADAWDDDGAVVRDIPCPADAGRIAPPVDTRPVEVVPEGAEAMVVEVLTAAPADATPAQLLAQVSERMPVPTGERETAFPADVAVVDGEIGFAMGDADDCLLVKRSADGVTVLHVPSILLQPGELGCTPRTALAPGDQLRSPH